MIVVVALAVFILSMVIWALLPNPGFTPGIDRPGAARHPYFVAGIMTFAHQGGDREMPGGTMETFRRAAALGVDAFELDVRLSADGILMVNHDETVDGTTNATGRIRDMTAARLQELDSGWWWPHGARPDRAALPAGEFPWRGKGLRMITLEELFTAFPDMRMNIDCKDHDEAAMAALAILVDRFDRFERTLVASFSHRTVADYRERFPGAATAASQREATVFFALSSIFLGRLSKPVYQTLQVPATVGRMRVVTPRFIRSAHRLGINVVAWTIDDRAFMQRLIAMGVDGIISGRPSVLMEVVGRA